MRVCLINNLYGENARGGAERVVRTEAQALAKAGHDVTVMALDDGGVKDGTDGAVSVVRIHAPNVYAYSDGHRHSMFVRFLWHVIDIRNIFSGHRVWSAVRDLAPDVVHTHNLMGLGFVVPFMIRLLGVRHVHTVHDVQLIHPSGLLPKDPGSVSGSSRMARSVYIALLRWYMGSPDVVIFPSRFLAKMHQEHGFFRSSRIEILPNPIAPVAIPVFTETAKPVVLFVGQLERHKGIDLLLDAWAEIGHGATLEIAGSGADEDMVRERTERLADVVVHGKLDSDGMDQAYARATFVVVPSRVIENQPTVILEAHARGIPVVAAAIGGIPEIVEEGVTGFLFPPDDADVLAAALRRAISMAGSVAGMREGIRERAARYASDTHREELERIYKEEDKEKV